MTRFFVFVLLAATTALGTEGVSPTVPSDQTPLVTFNKDVLPILQANCQVCHRPGSVAPMSFMTYESARPWAKAIKTAVVSKKMPPWFADPHYGEFRNAARLSAADISTLAAWADGGAREGDATGKPEAREWKDGWRIQPDVVVSAQPYRVAAQGVGEVREFFVQSPFNEDTWVSAIEIRPGDPSVVHHVIVQVPETRTAGFSITVCADCAENAEKIAVMRQAEVSQHQVLMEQQLAAVQAQVEAARGGAPAGRTFVAANGLVFSGQRGGGGGSYSDVLVRLRERQTGRGSFTTMEAVYAPGSPPLDFRYSGSAKLIPGGKPIRIEVHYTPNGKETLDQTKVAFTLAKEPAQRRFVMMAPEHLVDIRKPIPAGEENWETRGELTFNQDADLVWFMPHMHLRGKDMTFRLIHPDGREETVLSAKFNFNWQLSYEVERPVKVEKGTRMVVTAHHDNSLNNPYNPTPGQPVIWGEMTAQEMMLPWFGVVVDRNAQPDTIATYRPGDLDGPFPMPPAAGDVVRIPAPSVTVRPND
jgi:hypothetical protein